MPVAVVLLVAVMVGGAGYWAWSYQHWVIDLVHSERRSQHPRVTSRTAATPEPTAAAAAATATANAVGSSDLCSPVATAAREESSHSVLGWAQFSVISVVVMDGTAIVACRRADDEPGSRLSRKRTGRSAAQEQWPLLLTTDQTLVLLVGSGSRSERAHALLERWRQAGTLLWLRPTAVAGGIEFFDGHHTALRTALLAD